MKTVCKLMAFAGLLLVPPVGADDEAEQDRESLRQELREARKEMAEAARRVAELGRELGAEAGENYRFAVFAPEALPELPRRAMLGIGIGRQQIDAGGVEIQSVTPGGPADKAGLRAGDIITRIGKTDLAKTEAAPAALLEALRDVEPGTAVELKYRRGNDERSAAVTTEAFDAPLRILARGPGRGMPDLPRAPMFLELMHGWGDMELVPVSKQLGEYFGTERGLLVVRAPAEDGFRLQDGDVILSIAGRQPEDPAHAMRILRSYRGGETLSLEILRKRKKQTLEVEVPEHRSSEVLIEPLEREIEIVAPAPQ